MITLASAVTLSRILLTPIVVVLLLLQAWTAAAIFFVCAAATDLIDGFVARRFGQLSRFGQLLDPIADKCLLMATLFTLLFMISVEPWHRLAVFFLLIKEAVLLLGGALLVYQWNFFIVPSRLSRAASLAEVLLVLLIFSCLIVAGTVFLMPFSGLIILNVTLSVLLLMRYLKLIYNFFSQKS